MSQPITDPRLRLIDEGLIVAVGAPPASPDPDVVGRLDELESDVATLTATAVIGGMGSPEGVLARPVGTLYTRTDGGPMATLYIKEAGGSTATGWVPVG